MDSAFVARLAAAIADLRLACGVAVVWKDADPRWWGRLPAALTQHLNPHCLAVKAERVRLARCIGIDGLEEGDFRPDEAFRWRTCPLSLIHI